MPNMKIIPLNRTYEAKLFSLHTEGLEIKSAGTLDGFVDLSISSLNGGGSLTYSLTPDEALSLSSLLTRVVDDIKNNCLYDKDSLLMKD